MGMICTGLNHIGIIFTMVYFILIGIVWDTDMVDTDMVDTDMVDTDMVDTDMVLGFFQSSSFYRNTNVAYVSGRRGSTSLGSRSSSFSSRVSKNNYTGQSRISDNMINSNLRDRTSRVEKLNQTLATKPNYNSNARPSNANLVNGDLQIQIIILSLAIITLNP